MVANFRSPLTRCLFILLLVCLNAWVRAATFDVLVDKDNNAGTGCTVLTAAGAFGGVEHKITTTVDTGVYPPVVTGVVATECNPNTNTFGGLYPISPGGWPVSIGSGVGGYDSLETLFTVNAPYGQYRLGFVYNDPSTGSDAVLTTDGAANGAAIVLDLGLPPVIPTLAHGALFLLAFGLALLALRRLRAHRVSMLIVAGVLGAIVAGTALAAIVLDGMMNDWLGIPPVATDANDAPSGADIAAIYLSPSGTNVYVRADIKMAAPPQFTSANATTFTVGSPGSFAITTFGIPPVSNITQGGALPAGVQFNYIAGQSIASLSGTPNPLTGGVYPLTFTATNGVPPAGVQNFTLTVNEAPALTSGNSLTCAIGVACSFTVTTTGYPKPAIARGGVALPNGMNYVDNGNGTGTLSGTPQLGTVGGYALTFTASNTVGSTASQNFTLTVNQATTTTALASTPNPSVIGQPVTFTATVTPQGSGVPGGTVVFTIDGNPQPPVTLAGGGVATLATTMLAVGPHTVVAAYQGDPNFQPSTSAPLPQTVSKANASAALTLTAGTNPSVFGQPLTFTATVGAVPPGIGIPGGTVTFKDGAAILCPAVVLAAGQATCNVSTLGVGAHTLTVDYNGDANFNIATSPGLGQTVNKADTTTLLALTGGAGISVYGQALTFTATVAPVAPGIGTPTGTVTFNDGVTPICAAAPMAGGVATCTTTLLSVNAHMISAGYSGDAGFNGSTSNTLAQTVNKADTTTAIINAAALAATPSAVGEPYAVNWSVSVNAPGSAATPLSGNVSVSDGTGGACSAAVGAGTCNLTSTSPGTKMIVATYAGDGSYNGSLSAPASHTVNAPAVANPDNYTVTHDTMLGIAAPGVLGNDSGVPSPTLTEVNGSAANVGVAVPTAAGGTVLAMADGSFSYAPPPDFAGSDSFTYTAGNIVGPSAPATVTITVTNFAPVVDLNGVPAGIDYGPVSYNENDPAVAIVDPLQLTVVDSDSVGPTPIKSASVAITNLTDVGSEILAVTCPLLPPSCTTGILAADVVYDAMTGVLTITGDDSAANYQTLLRSVTYRNTSDKPTGAPPRVITFTVNDHIADNNPLAQATVEVIPVNDAPAAANNSATTVEVTPVAITLSATDAEGATLTFSIVAPPAHGGLGSIGSVTCTTDVLGASTCTASVTYTATAGYTGPDTFTYKANDGGADSNVATVSITVNPANIAPVIDSVAPTTATEDVLYTYNATRADPDGPGQNWTLLGTHTCGGSIVAGTGVFTFTPPGPVPPASCVVAIQVCDGGVPNQCASQTTTVTITAVNDAPVIDSTAPATATEDVLYTYNATRNDPDGPSQTWTLLGTHTCGGSIVGGTGVVTFTPLGPVPPATCVVAIQVCDGGTPDLCAAQTTTVTITAVNDAPVINSVAPATATEDVLYTYNATRTDPDGPGQTWTLVAGTHTCGGSIVAPTGVFTFTPLGPVPPASCVLAIQVCDGGSPDLCATQTSTVTITAVNDAPTANGLTNLPAQAGTPISYPAGTLGGTDPEGTAIIIDTTPINVTNGTVTINADGSFTFTPLPLAATASFQYRVSDSGSPLPALNSPYVTVSFVVSGPAIFFVKNPAVGLANCTLGNECLLATALTNIGAANNTNIFLGDANTHTAAGTIGLNLGGSIIGQGIATGFDTFFGIVPPLNGATLAPRPATNLAFPTVANTVALGTSSKVQGFNIAVTGDVVSGLISGMRTGVVVELGTITTSSNSATPSYAVNAAVSTGTFSFGNIAAGGTGTGSHGVFFNSTTSASTVTFANVTTANGTALDVQGSGATNFSAGAITATNGKAVNLGTTSGTFTFTSVSSGGGVNNVALTAVGGTVTLGGGALSAATGDSFLVSGGTGTITYGGTIASGSAHSVNITGKTGGAVTFDGAITDTDTGISLTTNPGATITLRGGLSANTGTNAAFTATGGGTINVCDENPCNAAATGALVNTLTTTTAAALTVSGTTIGANNLEFRSISSNGAPNGIVLNTTGGSGGLVVKGNGGSCTSAATCTGGAIQNSTNAAISLTGTLSPSFTRIAVQNAARSGIDGQGVTNFTLANSLIDNVGTGAAGQYEESNVAFNDGGAFTTANLTGVVSITNNTLTNARRHGIQIENGTGTISNLAITGNTLTSSTNAAVSLGTGILVMPQGSAGTTAHVTTGNISNNVITNFPSLEGIALLGGSGNAANNTSSTLGANGTPIAITNNTIRGQAAAGQHLGSNAIRAAMNSQVGVMNLTISCNGKTTGGCTAIGPITNIEGQGISVFAGGTVTGTTTIDNNIVIANQTLGAGTQGLAVQVDDGPAGLGTSSADYNVTITNNAVSNYEGNGIRAIARASLGKLDVTINNNTVGAPILANRNGIRVDSGSASGDVALCLAMTGNASAGSGVNAGIGLRKQGTIVTTNDFGIVGLVPSPASAAQADAKVTADNPAGNGVDILNGDNFVSCTITP